MFTGIIEGTGSVTAVTPRGSATALTVEASFDLSGIPEGGSIAVDGACLTVTGLKGNVFMADVSHETLKHTTLSRIAPGGKVNLERPLTLSKPLGGHMVTGHVDCVGLIKKKTRRGAYLELEITVPGQITAQVVKKGSVAVDGISLTVTEVSDRAFEIILIPHTMKNTTLPDKAEGEPVNIETDIMAKYAEKFFRRLGSPEGVVTEQFLLEHGFVKKG